MSAAGLDAAPAASGPDGAAPQAAASSSPAALPAPHEDTVAGAGALKAALSDHGGTVAADIVNRLDSFGITIADVRFSLWSLLVALLVLVGLLVFARVATAVAHRLLCHFTHLTPSQELLSEKLVTIVIWALSFFIGIDLLGIDLTALTVFSGAFGLAIGFGLQKTFGNLIAGIILLMDRSIKPGDVIAVSDNSGRETFGQIRKIGVRAISVVTRDKKEYLIPNENLMVNQVENWSYSSREVRIKAPVGVAYGTDLDLTEQLMCRAATEAPRVLKHPKPRVLLTGFGDNSVEMEIRFWIMDPEEGVSGVRSEVYKRLWRLFRENGVEIPFPQRDINLRDSAMFRELLAALSSQRGSTAGTAGSTDGAPPADRPEEG